MEDCEMQIKNSGLEKRRIQRSTSQGEDRRPTTSKLDGQPGGPLETSAGKHEMCFNPVFHGTPLGMDCSLHAEHDAMLPGIGIKF
jgi:hypothetical protein